jgi:hypothetical protein
MGCGESSLHMYSIAHFFHTSNFSANFTQTKQVMKSLTVIMCITIITWPISTLLFNIIKSTVALADQQTYKLYVSILLNIGLCVNFFVYI